MADMEASQKESVKNLSSQMPLGEHWVGYQNPQPILWPVLIEQVPGICSNVPELK